MESGEIVPEYLIHQNVEFSMLAFIFHIKKNIKVWPILNKPYLQSVIDYASDHIPEEQIPFLFRRLGSSSIPDVFALLPVDEGASPSDIEEAKEYRWDLFRCHFDHYITNDKPFWKNDAVLVTNGVLLLHAAKCSTIQPRGSPWVLLQTDKSFERTKSTHKQKRVGGIKTIPFAEWTLKRFSTIKKN